MCLLRDKSVLLILINNSKSKYLLIKNITIRPFECCKYFVLPDIDNKDWRSLDSDDIRQQSGAAFLQNLVCRKLKLFKNKCDDIRVRIL